MTTRRSSSVSTARASIGTSATRDIEIKKEALRTLAINPLSDSQQFSKDIATDEFYVLQDVAEELSGFEVEVPTPTKVSIVEPDKISKREDEEAFNLSEDFPTEEETSTKEKLPAEEPNEDFFDQVIDEDVDKKQVVEEIAGMTETVEGESQLPKVTSEILEIPTETKNVEEKPEEHRPSTIQFSRQLKGASVAASEISVKRVPSKKSIERESIARKSSRRASGIPELMKLSKRSLLALSSSADGSVSIVPRKSLMVPLPGVDPGMVFYSESTRTSRLGPESRRGTYYSELGPRYRDDDEDLLAGFDVSGDAPIFFEVIQEEEEDVTVREEDAVFKLQRAPYYDRHDKAAQEIAIRKIKNFLLQKKLAMYYKRKKMDYVTKDTDWSFDGQIKYNKKLEAYGDLLDLMTVEKARITEDLEETKKQKNDKFKKLSSMFKKMQDREGEIGYGLINTKTGNALPDKFVERLIRRQDTQMTQVSSMRLTYIRLKGMVQEKLDAISNLDEIAPGFLLVDYEQLKSDNRGYADKIEEKDEELTRLRSKCGNTIQVLAHLREKTAALDSDVEDLVEEIRTLEGTYFFVRSRLNQHKQNRDVVRHALNKMRDESGLLTQPTLLRDMEQGLKEFQILNDRLGHVMREHKRRAKQIKIIRKKIEHIKDLRRGLSRRSLIKMHISTAHATIQKGRSSKVYKGRPSLMMPIIEENAFDSLRTIKPKLTYNRSQRKCFNIKHNIRKEG